MTTNLRRASWADAAVTGYRAAKFDQAEDEADVRDLLSDLMHMAAAKGLDFEDELRIARGHFAEEAGQGPVPRGHQRLTVCLVSDQPVSMTGTIDVPSGVEIDQFRGEELSKLLAEQNPGIEWVARDRPDSIDIGWVEETGPPH